MFNRITDIGHPNVVKIGLIMGGYAGEGLITQAEAVKIMNEGISTHLYLKQKADTYKITALWAIYEGIDAPLKLITTSTTTRPSSKQIDNFLKA
jgi:predicted homoserine dehydrogenase-like protein